MRQTLAASVLVVSVAVMGSQPTLGAQSGSTVPATPLRLRDARPALRGEWDASRRRFVVSPARQASPARTSNISWAKRHPAATGALIGLAGGFLIGVATTEGDISPTFMGLVWGGGGAAVGALIGKAASEP